jgi:putative heme iron utilization protein
MADEPSSAETEALSLISTQRWAALATVGEGPLGSMVAYAVEPGLTGLLLFLSGLSAHTRRLLADGRASLAVSAPDPGHGDPQALPRVSLTGVVEVIERRSAEFPEAWERYVARFPEAGPRVGLGDFQLFRLRVEQARYVGGFAQAHTISGDRLRAAAGWRRGD